METDLEIDDVTTGRRPLSDTDSASVAEYDSNLKHIMVDDPVTGRRPAITVADLWAYGGVHQSMMIDDLTNGRRPMGSDGGAPVTDYFLLMETGDSLLLESGSKIILE